MDVAAWLNELRDDPAYAGQLVAHHRLAPRGATTAPLDPPLPETLAAALARQGIGELYIHQVEAIGHARARRDAVVVTGTASGKTLCYNLPVIERILADRSARALYLFPLKALAHDQRRKVEELNLWREVRCGTYDGDTPEHERRSIRAFANLVMTNPDMLHLGILPRHALWTEFLAHLEYLVIDEVHLYRGVFGSHTAQVIRRLLRLCERYGSRPTCLAASATIANPAELCRQLTGREFAVVDRDGSPAGARHLVVWNPPLRDERTGLRRSGNIEATWLLSELVRRGTRVLGFALARQEAELVLRYLRSALEAEQPELVGRVSAYRAGYLPTERRDIERRLVSGELLAVVSTVALEAGIDIGGLDAAVMIGYPGTIAGFWQQAGRAGRGRRDSLAVLVTRASLIDQFFAAHPETLWAAPTEQALVDPDNIYILGSHLLCAAYEHPLGDQDRHWFGENVDALLPIFADEGYLEARNGRWYYLSNVFPAAAINLRSAGNDPYTVVNQRNAEALGVEDTSRLWSECFPGAIHLQEGEQYRVTELDQDQRIVRVEPVEVDYYTAPMVATEVAIDELGASRAMGDCRLALGELTVTRRTVGYRRHHIGSMEVLEVHDLDGPPQSIETAGFWLTVDDELRSFIEQHGGNVLGGLHAVEHALAAALPLTAMCDPRDVQGSSTPWHDQAGGPALFIYDQYPGGIGLTERGYEAAEPLFRRAYEVVRDCPCQIGCPACIQSPQCGVNNQPLDKVLALVIFRAALGETWREEV